MLFVTGDSTRVLLSHKQLCYFYGLVYGSTPHMLYFFNLIVSASCGTTLRLSYPRQYHAICRVAVTRHNFVLCATCTCVSIFTQQIFNAKASARLSIFGSPVSSASSTLTEHCRRNMYSTKFNCWIPRNYRIHLSDTRDKYCKQLKNVGDNIVCKVYVFDLDKNQKNR